MKKIHIAIFTFTICISLLCTSCIYGLNEFLYRSDEANTRSPDVVNLNKSGAAPDIGTSSEFSVVVITDVHFGRNSKKDQSRHDDLFLSWLSAKQAELLSQGKPIKFCICLGDSTETGLVDDYQLYADFCARIKTQTGLVVYSITGNHDLMNSGWSHWKSTVYPYVSSYFFETAQGDKKFSWYFLDSGNGTLGYRQMKSCIGKMNRDENPKIVFSHYPIYAGGIFYFTLQNETERDTLLSAFASNNVKMVLEGQMHEGKKYSFGNKFTEIVESGYLDYRTTGVLTVNLTSQSVAFDEFSF